MAHSNTQQYNIQFSTFSFILSGQNKVKEQKKYQQIFQQEP
jgi:hypothetical protein